MNDKIIRHRASGYIALPGDILFDKEVSSKCRGIYLTVMALPDDWEFSVKGLCGILPDGENAIRSALKQLSHRGWLCYLRTRDEKGRVTGTEWHFYDKRIDKGYPYRENPHKENPYRENPDMEKPNEENPDMEKPNEENPAQFKYQLSNIPTNSHTHTAAGGNSVEEEKLVEPASPAKITIDNFIKEKCPELYMRLKPVTNKQAELLLKEDRLNMCQLMLEMNAKAMQYDGRSVYDVYITFKNSQYRRGGRK